MRKALSIVLLLFLFSCGQSTKENSGIGGDSSEQNSTIINETVVKHVEDEIIKVLDCSEYTFSSAIEQADSILFFLEGIQNSSSLIEKQKWEQKFFCAFPNSFAGMQDLFGCCYDDTEEAPLYSYPDGDNVLSQFCQLKSIPDSIYYDKYIRININGVWEADYINEAFGFESRLLDDAQNACKALLRFSDPEIESVFRFIFDGPHPKNEYNEKKYKELKEEVESQNKRLEQILTKAYKKILSKDDGHGQ